MDKPHCFWCHEYHDIMYEKTVPAFGPSGNPKGQDVEFFCSEDCFSASSRFLKVCSRFYLPFVLLLAAILGGIFYSLRLSTLLGLSLKVFLGLLALPIGILLQFVPFTTAETIRVIGMQKARWMMRMVGVFLIIFALAFII